MFPIHKNLSSCASLKVTYLCNLGFLTTQCPLTTEIYYTVFHEEEPSSYLWKFAML